MTTKRIFQGFSIVIFLLLQYQLWLAPGNLLDVWQLSQVSHQIKSKNQALYQRNLLLAADIDDLRSGEESVEERARFDLGMIKNGEEFYQVIQ